VPIDGWYRRPRLLGLLVLAVVTVYGLRETAIGDGAAVARYWHTARPLLPLFFALTVLDVVLECVAWMWVFDRFGLRVRDAVGLRVFVAGNAGRLMPAQLGRLIRPDAMARLGRGSLAQCCKAEASVFVLDAVSVVALLAAVIAWWIHPLLAPVAGAGVIAVSLYLGDRLAERLAGSPLGLPAGFWWSWSSAAIAVIELLGWTAHGVAFYVLVSELPGTVGLWDALLFAPLSAVLGVGSGLPGGLGATEGLLGISLRIGAVPAAHLAPVLGAFRLATFWIWIPIGWAALALVRRRAEALGRGRPPVSVASETAGPLAPEPVTPGGLTFDVDGP
jgi:uncharacterized membrane protein YbhN (UPF0104 family)